ELRIAADPDRAPQMQAYMKSAMPYLGIRVPQVRALVRAQARRQLPTSTDELAAAVRTLWFDAAYREERYAATALLDVPAARRLRTPQLVELYAELIVDGAWWDHVDELSHRVGELLREFPARVRPVVRTWSRDPDPWLRRAAIICQLGARKHTDLDLLADAIGANAADPGFFLRKAIGWALRDYARTDPDWVRRFVAAQDLSPLSRREALKHVGA
ncbi:MAG TPA: DNA alkylation repair protein, partial [Jatrophihabitans sp.]|nr:DNA alkylation repair protein [Jatrophihabitans sp.]